MPLHKMGPLIKSAMDEKIRLKTVTRERGAVEIINTTGTTLHTKSLVFAGGHSQHVEPSLFNDPAFQAQLGSAAKVYLYTYFAPCPDCYKFLVHYPLNYQGVKFYLAYSDSRPLNANYKDAEVEQNLKNLHIMGWKVRMWGSGQYHPPAKYLGGKRFDTGLEKTEREFGYPVTVPTEMYLEDGDNNGNSNNSPT